MSSQIRHMADGFPKSTTGKREQDYSCSELKHSDYQRFTSPHDFLFVKGRLVYSILSDTLLLGSCQRGVDLCSGECGSCFCVLTTRRSFFVYRS